MGLEQVFSPQGVMLNLESTEREELFEEMLERLVSIQPGIDRAEALEALRERESKMSTGIMHGIAVPHGTCSSVQGVVGAVGMSRGGVDYDALDKAPVHLVFLFLCNPEAQEKHLSVLRDLAPILQEPSFFKEVMEKTTAQDVFDLLCHYQEILA